MTQQISPPTPAEPADEAIPKLLELYGNKIHALGLRLCGGPQEAEDIVQETFLSAFRHWDSFEGRSKPSTWLFTIASRACQRLHRRRSGEPNRIESLENLLPTGIDSLPDPASLEPTAIDETLQHELQEVVHAAISDLPMNFRLPLVLKDLADFKVSEIAEILGIKEATVKTRIHRARLALRKALSESLPQRRDQRHNHDHQICLDLLYAKQEALDQGLEFPMADDEFCHRCHTVFKTLDLLNDTCHCLKSGRIPAHVRESLKRQFAGFRG